MIDVKAAPCAWCGKEPKKSNDIADYRSCPTRNCPESLIEDPFDLEIWNARQAAIMEARRKDFEAGVSATLGTKMSWQDRDSWFDDYIKETK